MDSPTLKREILLICPDFQKAWDDEGSLWCAADGTYTFHGLFAVLSHHVADLLEKGNANSLGALFTWVERQMTGSDGSLSNAAATCFLENLMNRVPTLFSFESFEPLLGPTSKAFCEVCGQS
jgi:hypothetical protein